MKRQTLTAIVAAIVSVVPVLAARCALAASSADVPTASERRTPVVKVVEKTGPAVVNVYTETVVNTPFRSPGQFSDPFEELLPDLFGNRRRVQERQSLGSGVIVDPNGTIVTNEHVIVQASTIRVLLADKREFTAKLIGADSDFDLAVLKVDAKEKLPFIPLPTKESILIGETVVAIGNPYGLSHTVTVGVISAIGRTIQSGDVLFRDFIQTDASINPGNSGGPLINIEGDLVGINTAILGQAQGIGFSIPATRARNVVDQILHYGAVQPYWIGVAVQDLTPDLAFHFGVEAGTGVLVSSVETDSPAATAGISVGQVIESVDGEQVGSSAEFDRRTLGVTSGDQIELTVLDAGRKRTVPVRVGALPPKRIDDMAWQALGVEVQEGGGGPGVRVARVRADSPAQEIGLAAGDFIAAIGGRDVRDPDDFRRGLAAVRTSNQVLVSVVRGRVLYRVTIPLERPGGRAATLPRR